MSDYIDRQELIKNLKKFAPEHYTGLIDDLIRKQPAADVRPVVCGIPVLKYRPQRYERYEEMGLNEKGEMLYLKRVYVDEKKLCYILSSLWKKTLFTIYKLLSKLRSRCERLKTWKKIWYA